MLDPDHPRGCGEHTGDAPVQADDVGSSPRMRGARIVEWQEHLVSGIIPADAGSTSFLATKDGVLEDHPRGCGEHQSAQTSKSGMVGSSPRMRGALGHRTACRLLSGIIPADAGSTARTVYAYTQSEDHPRGCGEHLKSGPILMPTPGSSPRMRGARKLCIAHFFYSRIIPADAGSTRGTQNADRSAEDHPRGCGEHEHGHGGLRSGRGSSPRMRGALTTLAAHSLGQRIIPADAGSTHPWQSEPVPSADHPRGCREHSGVLPLLSYLLGSSPRMRGAQQFTVICGKVEGIIPADAGSTSWVHLKRLSTWGSSPRMRGAPTTDSYNQQRTGIIPADAGSTVCHWSVWVNPRDHPRGCGEHIFCTIWPMFSMGSSPRMRGAQVLYR